mgnify:CR=1 FL=1
MVDINNKTTIICKNLWQCISAKIIDFFLSPKKLVPNFYIKYYGPYIEDF